MPKTGLVTNNKNKIKMFAFSPRIKHELFK